MPKGWGFLLTHTHFGQCSFRNATIDSSRQLNHDGLKCSAMCLLKASMSRCSIQDLLRCGGGGSLESQRLDCRLEKRLPDMYLPHQGESQKSLRFLFFFPFSWSKQKKSLVKNWEWRFIKNRIPIHCFSSAKVSIILFSLSVSALFVAGTKCSLKKSQGMK